MGKTLTADFRSGSYFCRHRDVIDGVPGIDLYRLVITVKPAR